MERPILFHKTLTFRLNTSDPNNFATILLYGNNFLVKSENDVLVWDYYGEKYIFTYIGESIYRTLGTNDYIITWLGYPDLMFELDYDINNSSSSSLSSSSSSSSSSSRSSSSDMPTLYFSTWPSTLDSYYYESADTWNNTKNLMVEMRDLGVSHVGVYCNYYYNIDGSHPANLADLQNKLTELRTLDLKFTILTHSNWLQSPFYIYSFKSGTPGVVFQPGETVTSGSKSAKIRATVDGSPGNGTYGTVTLTLMYDTQGNPVVFVNNEIITGSWSGKTATINGSYSTDSGLQALDGSTNISNGLDSRFFDTPGWRFNAYAQAGTSNPSRNDRSTISLDPSYTGSVWSTYLHQNEVVLDVFGFTNYDFYYNDIEMWRKPTNWALNNWNGYGTIIQDSTRCGANPTPNSSHNQAIAFANYEYNWLQRARDITNLVHTHASRSHMLHYDEWSQQAYDDHGEGWWYPGSGDFTFPTLYFLDDLSILSSRLAEGHDWTGAMASISFTFSNGVSKRFSSTDNTRTAGAMFKSAGFIGFYEWQGYDYLLWKDQLRLWHDSYDEFIDYYKSHLIAFLDGYNNG